MGFEVSAVRITKKFKNSVALDGASISAKNGISVIIGPNGAGRYAAEVHGRTVPPESGTVRDSVRIPIRTMK